MKEPEKIDLFLQELGGSPLLVEQRFAFLFIEAPACLIKGDIEVVGLAGNLGEDKGIASNESRNIRGGPIALFIQKGVALLIEREHRLRAQHPIRAFEKDNRILPAGNGEFRGDQRDGRDLRGKLKIG